MTSKFYFIEMYIYHNVIQQTCAYRTLIIRGLCKTVLLYKFFPKVFGRFKNPHVLFICCGFESIHPEHSGLTKIPGFAKPSINETTLPGFYLD